MFCCGRASRLTYAAVAVAGVSPILWLVADRASVPPPTGEGDVPGFFLVVFVGRPVVDRLLIWGPHTAYYRTTLSGQGSCFEVPQSWLMYSIENRSCNTCSQ